MTFKDNTVYDLFIHQFIRSTKLKLMQSFHGPLINRTLMMALFRLWCVVLPKFVQIDDDNHRITSFFHCQYVLYSATAT